MAGLFVLALVGACKGKQASGPGSGSAVAAAGSGSGSASAGSAAAVVVADAGSGAGSAAAFVPPKLDEKQGVIFADKAGGKVQAFADGAVVEVAEVKDMSVGSEESGEITVKDSAGKPVKLAADRVLIEEALTRSPDGKWVVFAPIVACGDFCHSVVWFIGADGRRAKLGDGGPGAMLALSPDGKTAAVGSQGLWLVTLADFKVKAVSGYMSPVYGPDGTLYARDHTGAAFTVGEGKPKRVWKAPKMSAEDEEMNASEEPRPVQFKDGKPVFDEPWWDGPGGDQ
jgi:hypothetical protein